MRAEGESWGLVDVPADAAVGPTVAEVMVRDPKVLPVDAAVGHVRALLEDDHVHMVLLTHGRLLRGTVVRGDVPDTATDVQKAICFAHLRGRTVPATAPADAVLPWLAARQQRRLAVVDDGGLLVGLLCLKARGTGFCSDADVAARAASGATETRREAPQATLSGNGMPTMLRRTVGRLAASERNT